MFFWFNCQKGKQDFNLDTVIPQEQNSGE